MTSTTAPHRRPSETHKHHLDRPAEARALCALNAVGRFKGPRLARLCIQNSKASTWVRAPSMKASATSWNGAASTLDWDWSSKAPNSR